MRAQRDRYEYLLEMERGELEEFPEEEREELVLIYQAKGLTKVEAETVADRIMRDPEIALDTMAREELGLNPNQLGSPRGAAASSFVAFAAGAFVPVLPHTVAEGDLAFALSGILSILALFAVGSLLSVLSGKRVLRGGLRMLLIGVVAATLTFGLGTLVGEIIGTGQSAL
jgi:VIT1/CCC1 family predicted Fe2+/Mn2+ transporter